VATIRACFLVDISVFDNLEVIYCDWFKNTQNQIKKYRKYYIPGIPDIIDRVIYTSDTIIDLKGTLSKFRKAYLPPDIPKLIVVD
jgi:uncharacterized protein YbcI